MQPPPPNHPVNKVPSPPSRTLPGVNPYVINFLNLMVYFFHNVSRENNTLPNVLAQNLHYKLCIQFISCLTVSAWTHVLIVQGSFIQLVQNCASLQTFTCLSGLDSFLSGFLFFLWKIIIVLQYHLNQFHPIHFTCHTQAPLDVIIAPYISQNPSLAIPFWLNIGIVEPRNHFSRNLPRKTNNCFTQHAEWIMQK